MKSSTAEVADAALSTSGLVTTPVPAVGPRPPALASPFVSRSASPAPVPPPPKPFAKKKNSRFPADFFATTVPHRSACYGVALNVLQANHRIPRDQGKTLLEAVHRVTDDALTWCCGWGGVAYWHVSLHDSFTNACEEDRDDEWEEELLEHAASGRHLLFQLTSTVELLAESSCKPHKLKELLRISMEMMQMVTMGLAILNMRCSILPDNVWRVERLSRDFPSEERAVSHSSGRDESSEDSDMSC